jgi:cytoskeletal protein CcmA (bactofilin family)
LAAAESIIVGNLVPFDFGENTKMANEVGGGNESRIGKGTKITGKLVFGAKARIEGEVEGEITGEEIILSEGAVVNARITAHSLTIAGTVNGEITAHQRIELLATARARGTLKTPNLVLHEGAMFDGDCKMPRDRIAA